jgi:hypothetical protein
MSPPPASGLLGLLEECVVPEESWYYLVASASSSLLGGLVKCIVPEANILCLVFLGWLRVLGQK